MLPVRSIRVATLAALGLVLVLWGNARAAQQIKPGAAEALEVQVLDTQVRPGQGERDEVLYRMEVLSVLRTSPSRVKPGDTIAVRAPAPSAEALAPGWVGVAYVNPDPTARGQFVAAGDDSLVKNPPGPPALRYTPMGGAGTE